MAMLGGLNLLGGGVRGEFKGEEEHHASMHAYTHTRMHTHRDISHTHTYIIPLGTGFLYKSLVL
jgi:hypothetical protein